jgi:hypothetical protein
MNQDIADARTHDPWARAFVLDEHRNVAAGLWFAALSSRTSNQLFTVC